MARVLFWRLAYMAAMATGGLISALIWPLRWLLALLCEAMDRAEVGWLLACSQRRLDQRRRVNVAERIHPLPGVGDDCR